jgi:hypothetical protein
MEDDMSMCRICGDPNGHLRIGNRGVLCDSCCDDTPRKVSREVFYREYFGADAATTPEAIKREFYDDYRSSTHTLADYIAATTSATV